MADLKEDQSQNRPVAPKEPSMEKRMLLAFLLMGAILFLTPYFYRTFFPQSARQDAPAATPGDVTPKEAKKLAEPVQPPVSESKPEAATGAPPATQPVAAQQEQSFVVDTEVYRVVFSNRGAVVRSWTLKKYKDASGKPLELVNAAAAPKVGYPFALAFENKKPSYDANQALFAIQPEANGLGATFEYANGATAIRKTFRFEKNSYLSQFSSSVVQNGAGVEHSVVWRGGFGDQAVPNASTTQHSLYYDASAGKLITQDSEAGEDGPITETGRYSFAGVEDTYFTAVLLPSGSPQVQVKTFSDTVRGAGDKETPHVGAAIGGMAQQQFSLFVGPKDIDLLKQVDPKLAQVVDWGWFGFIAEPLFLGLNWLNNNFVHNYGWAIVILTIVINFALLPLKLTSMKSMKKMQALQPQVAALNAKYKGISMRDPRKAQQNQEMMDLYKKHGVNPMGGCLPMVLQIPFFFAFYKVLMVSIDMRGAGWLWVSDLSQPEQLPIRILPIAMIVSQFVMQKMTPTTTADPAQQRMMLFMPLIFGFMFYHFSSGLVLYWLTSNLVGIAQQWGINKFVPTPVLAKPEPVKQKRRG